MRAKVRIGIVSHFPPPPGGMPGQAEAMLHGLRQERITARAIRTNLGGGTILSALERLRFVRTILRWPVFLVRLLLAVFSVDVLAILSCSGVPFFLFTTPAVLAGRSFGRRVVVHYHGGAAATFFRSWPRFVRFVLKRADRVVVPSQFLVQAFTDLGLDVTVVPNILDLETFSRIRSTKILPRFVVARHLEEDYNIGCILRAFAPVRNVYPDAVLFLLGSGSQESALRKLAETLGVADAVRFLGYVPNDRVPEIYSRASIALNSSNVDNLPVFLMEAFAAGLPVVSTCAGGIPFLVEDGKTGLLVGLNDHVALAEKILLLLGNPGFATELADNARKEVSRYSWPAVFAQLATIYGVRTEIELTHVCSR